MKKFLAVIAAAFCILTVLNTAHTAGKDEAEKKDQVKICISMPVDIATRWQKILPRQAA